ncbi:Uncharacterized protein SCF082_LOCUS22799 [Durusdinium trenchii]|uniref:Cyclic nucleotide-binding domain-containing protein n=1 Tax=Durusdinium trenchii TaxID=1381693 RepID=A0ABP0LKV8_9DINO
MITRCCGAFPGMPPEVVWAIAEHAEQCEVPAGEVFIKEGDDDEDLVLIEEGVAIVEKTVANGDRPSSVEIGKLGATAIIGDIALIGAALPRPASVRAGNVTEILRIPATALAEVLRRFPGCLQGITARLKEAGNFLMMKMPVRYDVVNSLEVFAETEVSFKKEVAAHGRRYVCTIGEVVADGIQPSDECIYVMEYGVCSLQNEIRQELEEVSTGSVFAVNDTVATKPQTVRDARGTTVFIRGVLKGGLGQVERWKHPEGNALRAESPDTRLSLSPRFLALLTEGETGEGLLQRAFKEAQRRAYKSWEAKPWTSSEENWLAAERSFVRATSGAHGEEETSSTQQVSEKTSSGEVMADGKHPPDAQKADADACDVPPDLRTGKASVRKEAEAPDSAAKTDLDSKLGTQLTWAEAGSECAALSPKDVQLDPKTWDELSPHLSEVSTVSPSGTVGRPEMSPPKLPKLPLSKLVRSARSARSAGTQSDRSDRSDRVLWLGTIMELPAWPAPPPEHPLITPRTGASYRALEAMRQRVVMTVRSEKTSDRSNFSLYGLYGNGQDAEVRVLRKEQERELQALRKKEVVSPFAAIMEIRQKDLADALQRHYDQRRPPPFSAEILPQASSLQHLVAMTDIFSKVSMNFVQDLCAHARIRSYLPGQTLCIQAKQDKGQMFLVRGGSLVVEKDGRRRSEIGTCIGDLVILGAEHQRPCTVRAQSFVFTLEIPRSALLQAIDRHPECRRALENYALQTIGQYEDQGGGVQWPMQKAAPQRLSYLLNLYAGVKLYDPAESDWKRLADESAVLVVQGEALVMDEDGKEVEVLRIGDTFNEQILLGIPGGRTVSGLRFHIQTPCELQFVSLAVWEKVVSDFPQDQELIFRSIRDTMARKAAKKHGLSMSSPEMVRMSSLLRYLSDESIQDLAKHFEPIVVKPFAEIITKGKPDGVMLGERLECWDEVAELFGPPIVPLSDHTSSVVGASLTSQSPLVVVPSEEKPDPIVEFMSRMEPTRAAVMRATKWSRVLSWGGYVFRAKRGRNFYQLSFEVKHVEDFVSHSWQTSPWKKVLLLLVIQNGRAAGLVGTVAALLMAILWHFHSLPAWTFTRWSHTGMPFSFWSSSVGFLTALVTLFSWRKQSSVFVDRVCVNQFDPQMKVEGIISLGAILKSSSSMLVIWDESYVERLWCLFELAAFLKAHEEEAGRSERNGRSALRVKPLSLGWICVITSCALSVLSFHILVTPTDDSLMEWVIRLSCLTMLYTFIAVSRAHFRAMESAQQQLQCFRLEDATCWCCTVNHIDQDGPFTTCDRECVTKCILSWFGSTESFEQSVQSSVAKALSQQLGAGKALPYRALLID